MQEIELKVIEINKENLIHQLLEMGAKKVYDGEIIDEFLRRKNAKRSSSILRLRQSNDGVFLTSKRRIKNNQAKVMEENEIKVSDYNTTVKIMKSIGYHVNERRKKHRISYILGDTRFEFDKLDNIPCYLEIESSSPEKIYDFINKFGIDKKKVKKWNSNKLLKHYKAKNK